MFRSENNSCASNRCRLSLLGRTTHKLLYRFPLYGLPNRLHDLVHWLRGELTKLKDQCCHRGVALDPDSMQTGFVLWIEPQLKSPIYINRRSRDDRTEGLDAEFQWGLAARAASKRSNCKGPLGLPCAVTPQGTWPPCIPCYSSEIITILRPKFCPIVDNHKTYGANNLLPDY
jgi:hypothetical protein